MGKVKTQEILTSSNRTHEIPRQKLTPKKSLADFRVGIRGHYHESSGYLTNLQKSLLKSKPPKKENCQIFQPEKCYARILQDLSQTKTNSYDNFFGPWQ